MPVIEAALLEILACPVCHAPLRERLADGAGGTTEPAGSAAAASSPDEPAEPAEAAAAAAAEGAAADGAGTELVCTDNSCGLAYPVRDGIPVLLADEARQPRDAG